MVEMTAHPAPQHHARMGVFGCQLRPLRAPALQGQHDLRQLPARLGRLVDRARTVRLGTDLDHPGAFQVPQPLGEQPARQPGAPSAISLKVLQPTRTMLRKMIKDQRSANSSDARAIGQYCP